MKKKTTTTTTVTTTVETSNIPSNTYYVFVLDRSGSMGPLQQQTINNFNEQIATLKDLESKNSLEKYFVTTVLFDHEIITLCKDIPVGDVKPLDNDTYVPRGMTSLHDAIGISIGELKERRRTELKNKEENSALITVMTDGEENNSKEWNAKKISELMDELNKEKNWTISFIGANKDSVLKAQNLGIRNVASMDFSSPGVYASASAGISNALYSRSYAKSKGVDLNTSYFAATISADGGLSDQLDLSKIDSLVKEAQEKEDDAADKASS